MKYLANFAPGHLLIITCQMIPVYSKSNINIHQTLKV
jgi:hypothetical protein